MDQQLRHGKKLKIVPKGITFLQKRGFRNEHRIVIGIQCWNLVRHQEGRRAERCGFGTHGGSEGMVWVPSRKGREEPEHTSTASLHCPGDPAASRKQAANGGGRNQSWNPAKLGRHCRAVTHLQDIKIKEWCIKQCGKCNLSFSTVNLWILMTGSHLHLTISVLEHFLETGDIFLSQ